MSVLGKLLLIWHFIPRGIFLEFDASHHAVAAVWLVLGATLVLLIMLIAGVRMLQLQWPGAEIVLAQVNPDLVSTAADVVFSDFRCNVKKWSCEVVGSYKFSGAIGPWNLLLLDFRHWTRRPSRRWRLLCYCTDRDHQISHKGRVVIQDAFLEGDWTTTSINFLPKYVQSDPGPLCNESSAFHFVDLTFHGQ